MEWIGQCRECGKAICCRDGFLDGHVCDDQQLICFNCADKMDDKLELDKQDGF